MKKKYPTIILLFLFCCKVLLLVAQDNSGNRLSQYNLKGTIGLQGYDPISYFDYKPQKGKASINYIYEGVSYHFVSIANLTKFKQEPQKYEPAYGGWCAYAMGARGEKVEVDPETYKILQGKLYLFYNSLFNNTLSDWNKNETYLKKKADVNWKQITSHP